VWTGAEAKRLGLVDELGGLDTAIKSARSLAGLKDDEASSISVYPRPRSWTRRMIDRAMGRADEPSSLEMLVEGLAPVAAFMRQLGALGDSGVLAMPPMEIR
jgi:protease-4